jgi:hypothetical protein
MDCLVVIVVHSDGVNEVKLSFHAGKGELRANADSTNGPRFWQHVSYAHARLFCGDSGSRGDSG